MEGSKDEDFIRELTEVINRFSVENGSNTPDFILAEYMAECLIAFDKASSSREKWYGIESVPDREQSTVFIQR